jgi:branched-chain amino acid transport system permease protein
VQLLQQLINGIAQGCIYGLIAIGFVLIYKATETVSFVQGELMMLGAFLGLVLITVLGIPYWLAVPATLVAMVVFGIVIERVAIRPILGEPAFSIVMLTLGIGYVARGAIMMIPGIGTDFQALPVPYRDLSVEIGGLMIGAERLVVIAVTALLCLLLFLMFRFTRVGIAMQAASQNQRAAYYMGIPVRQLNGLVWGLAAGVAAIAGLLLAPIVLIDSNMGFIGLKAFPAAVVGGMTSLPGALLGGVIIGVIESLAGYTLPEGFKDVAAYIVVLIMLMIRPNGLFGGQIHKKV